MSPELHRPQPISDYEAAQIGQFIDAKPRVGEADKSMKALELAATYKNGWRKIANIAH